MFNRKIQRTTNTMKRTLLSPLQILAGAAMLVASAAQAAQIDVFASSITAGASNHWSSANTYVLKEMVFVPDNTVLRIEPGTVIKGDVNASGTQTAIPCLVVARGGKLYAEGTPTQPIIFTASSDDLGNPSDLGTGDRGLWGGVVLLGKAVINSSKNGTGQGSTPKYDVFEGLTDLENLRFGGSDDEDSSGVLRYVSIRHGGRVIEVNKEINGLSLAAVGRGTVVEFVEVFANEDDGFEFFGGTVNTRYLVSAFCNDDVFDTDQGYRGQNQFWFGIQAATGTRNFGGEYAGDPVSPNNRTPLSDFRVWNATYIGAGVANAQSTANTVFDLKEDTAAKHYNCIFTDFADKAVKLQTSASTRFNAGDIDLRNNLWFGFGNGVNTATLNVADITTGDVAVQALFTDSTRTNLLVDPQLMGISRTTNGGLDPRPSSGSPALNPTNVRHLASNGFFVSAPYLGAFGSVNWAADWTALGAYGIITSAGARTGSTTPFVEGITGIVTFAGITVTGDVGSQYQIQYTTNLETPNWQTLTIVTIPAEGSITYIDPTAATGQARRFYQAVFMPQ